MKVHPDVCGPLVENCGTGMDGIKTFNISTAGSLANPAKPAYAVRGIYSEKMVQPIAEAMREIGFKRGG